MNKEKIAIIYTTFLRNSLAYETIQSIQSQLSENCCLLIADQNKDNNRINQNPNWHYTTVYNLPYDIGLSTARNYLIKRVSELNYSYAVITADSIKFTKKYDFTPMIEMLDFYPKLAKIGFNIENRQNFTYDLEISPKHNKFIVIKPRRSAFLTNNVEYTPCDMCCNFFIAKTSVLKEVRWDNELKLCEHEDHCYRLKQHGYYSLWSNIITATYLNEKSNEYNVMRKRLYGEFKEILKKKYNLNPDGSWLIYNHKLPKAEQL